MADAVSDAVRRQWARQVTAEYRSSALAQELTLWLTQLGASPDLIGAGLRIAADELEHARLSHEVYGVAGGTSAPPLDRANLAIARGEGAALERRVLDAAVVIFCLGETVAVPLFRHLRAGCDVAAPRAVLDQIVRDEPRHSSFGWDLLDWLLDGPCEGQEDHVAAALRSGFAALERAYGDHGLPAGAQLSPQDRGWGLAPRHEYADILRSTFDRVWQPRFGAYGIDPTPAWEARTSAWDPEPVSTGPAAG